jgi:5-methyltetrahydropteroyltriglutamate--homocysteine methyltransferase
MITIHHDHVGSLLRPTYLVQAREDVADGRIPQAQFKALEDRAVDELIALQIEAGLSIITDGEARRLSFQAQLPEVVEGFGLWDVDAFKKSTPSGCCWSMMISVRAILHPWPTCPRIRWPFWGW